MFSDLPKTRANAKSQGASHYFTGDPCKHGHVDKRLASTGACAECVRVRQRERMKNDPEYRELHRKCGLRRITRILKDPEQRKRIRDRENELQRTCEKRQAKKRIADQKRHRRLYESEEHRLRIHEKSVKYYHAKKTDPEYIEKAKIRAKIWCRNNLAKLRYSSAAYRARKKFATPMWLTDAMKESIGQFYWMATELSRFVGKEFEVDHVVPLQGETVCGLHVPWNLQILCRSKNRSKRNNLIHELALR